jgi:hypothetical protein
LSDAVSIMAKARLVARGDHPFRPLQLAREVILAAGSAHAEFHELKHTPERCDASAAISRNGRRTLLQHG